MSNESSKPATEQWPWRLYITLIIAGVLLGVISVVLFFTWIRGLDKTTVDTLALLGGMFLVALALLTIVGVRSLWKGGTLWPEVILLLLVVFVGWGIIRQPGVSDFLQSLPAEEGEIQLAAETPESTGTPEPISTPLPIQISLPAAKIMAGVNSLYPNQWIDLIVYRSDGTSTPHPAVAVQIVDIRGEGEGREVVVRVPANQVAALQLAAAATNAGLLYRQLPGIPTSMPVSTPTITPTPTPTKPPLSDPYGFYFELPTTLIKPRPDELKPNSIYRMVVITEQQEATASGNVITKVEATSYDVMFLAFLNDSGILFLEYNKSAIKGILVAVQNENATEIAAGLFSAKSIWLLQQPTPTPSPTPTQGS